MFAAYVVVMVLAAANAFSAMQLDSAVERRLPAREHSQSASGVAVAVSRSAENPFISLYSLPRKRDYESPLKCHWKIRRTRNGGAAMTADVLADENKDFSEGAGWDPFLR